MDRALRLLRNFLRHAAVASSMAVWLMMNCTSVSAADILLTAAEDTPTIQSFVNDLTQRRPRDQVRFIETAKMPSPGMIADSTRLVLLGPGSLDWRLSDSEGPMTLVLCVSRTQAHERLGEKRPPKLSLLWSDPPLARQLRLIRQLIPQAREVGVLFDNNSQFLLKELRHAAAPLGLRIVSQSWIPDATSRHVQSLLSRSDVLLGLDDHDLYNAKTAKNLLLSGFAQQRGLLGPDVAFVKAGSLASTYSDHDDWLDTLETLLDQPAQSWPRTHYPEHFKVLSNQRVARSLGIAQIDETAVALRLKAEEQKP